VESVADPSTRTLEWARQTAVQRAWDADTRRAAAAFPGRVVYLSTDELLAPGGRFYAWFPTVGGGW
jgi:hypothetical protein